MVRRPTPRSGGLHLCVQRFGAVSQMFAIANSIPGILGDCELMPRITEVKEGDRVTHKESANGFYDGVVTKVTDGENPVVHVALDSDSEFSEDGREKV